ncbi:MerR family transcriptional regulator [Vallitalea guaymasensis]|uniref:MerR family transcriptional regulator n=1 Tax=Vallitalea guaymasensis TaxID=1185412 RepID=UPI00272AF5A2|nr:MerR family transcriptional regulator [Vallitalea guaymasensis]
MKEYYTIGEISKIFSISTDTLRYYSKIGLIIPKQIRDNKYRYYSIEQFEMISTILFLRSVDIPIKKIQQLLHHENISKIQEEILKQENILQNKINYLKHLKSQIESFYWNSSEFTSDSLDIRIEKLPKLWVLSKPFHTNEIDLDIDSISLIHKETNQDWVLTSNIISILSKENLIKNDYHTYAAYGLISESPCPTKSDSLSVLNEGYYVSANTIIYEPNHSDVNVVYDRILDYIDKHHLEITGDAIERNVLDMFVNEQGDNSHYIKIIIPIK